ncbi:MAG: ABC transporter ATP-binding protein [Chloroflexi bacterium]|nr:ABC transporter ATP-binding protein [Chloroflexota bacterium]
MTDFAVSVNHVTFGFGHREVLKDLSLQIPAGMAFGLLGPNGAGKTTLIRLMVGLLKPKSGDIHVLGQLLSRKKSALIGYMPQLPSLYNELTVQQNVDFFAHIYRLHDNAKRAEQVEKVLKLVDLWERRRDAVQNLSGGMKQRASLACAIVHNPPILFLDEPTVGLDPELRVSFWEFFSTLTRQGTTLVISSHTMDDAAHCDRLGFIRDGKVIAEGSPAELRQATGNPEANLEDAFLYFVRRGKEAGQ